MNQYMRAVLISVSFGAACTAGDYSIFPECQQKELCGNNYDDDCDGMIDNPSICSCTTDMKCTNRPDDKIQDIADSHGLLFPKSRCRSGIQQCTKGQLGLCTGDTGPIDEQCGNGIDDNCDGTVDEPVCVNCINGQKQKFYPMINDLPPNKNYRTDSACQLGEQTCVNGIWQVTKPSTVGNRTTDTTCDGIDDDCDGVVDEDATWTSGQLTFKRGQPCYDFPKMGACRTPGKVICDEKGAAICDNTPHAADLANYYRLPATAAYVDSTNANVVWDWNCDGSIGSIFCVGSSPTCAMSNVPYNVFIARDTTTKCSNLGFQGPACNDMVIVNPPGIGAPVLCGTLVKITTCKPLAGSCIDDISDRDGYLYCR